MNLQQEYSKTQYLYTSLFCEENIWQLLKSLASGQPTIGSHKMWALIITNPEKKIALFNQKLSPQHFSQKSTIVTLPVIWDYHVIMLAEIHQQYYIFDFDTRLSFISPIQEYLQNTFITPDKLPQEFIPYIRKIPAENYLSRFYSDRTHMENQIVQSDFPPWPIINAGKKDCISLTDYLSIDKQLDDKSQILKVSSLTELKQWLSA